jgi:hypothetical protein
MMLTGNFYGMGPVLSKWDYIVSHLIGIVGWLGL